MTAAEELTTAADTLEALARDAQRELDHGDYWKCYEPARAWRDGFTNGMGGLCSELAAAIPPACALEMSRWLRAEARYDVASPHALAVARSLIP
jgi:hypothetical protein